MVVDHELEVSIHSGVDQTDAVRGTGDEGSVVSVAAIVISVGAVDKAIVERRGSVSLGGDVQLINRLYSVSLEPR